MKFEYNPYEMPDNHEKPSEDLQNSAFSHSDTFERNTIPYQEQFNTFFEELQGAKAIEEEVNGTMREYMTIASIYRIYESIFGPGALKSNSIGYRIKNINQNAFPDDVMVIEDAGPRESKYYINRLNKKLIEEIFVPSILPDEEFEQLKNEVIGLEDDFDAEDHLHGLVAESFKPANYTPEANPDDEE